MSIDVTRLDSLDADEWNDLLSRSPHATPFHLAEALRVIETHADATLHPLVGYKGQQPVGLFPVFEQHRGPLTVAASPAPELNVNYLGPVLLDTAGLKRRRLDKRNLRFVQACIDWIDEELAPNFLTIQTTPHYEDPRPFLWSEFDIETRYTYELDLTPGTDALFDAFSADARGNIRNVRDEADRVDVRVGDAADARRIVEHLSDQLDSRGVSFAVASQFVADLYEHLPEGVVRPYVCDVDGAFHGGLLALMSHGTVYRWQGGAKTTGDLDVNDYVDWHIIEDAIESGAETYDFVGASTPRLCWYKSKFAPDLTSHAVATRSSRAVNAISELYQRLR